MQVSQHLVGAPPSNEGDYFRVNACVEQGICSGSAQAAGRYILSQKSEGGTEVGNSVLQHGGDLCWSDGAPLVAAEARREWSLRRSTRISKVDNSACDGFDRAEGEVSTEAETDDFSSDTILLGIKGERGKRCATELGIGGICDVESSVAKEELDTLEVEGLGVRWGGGIFAWAEEKEEGNDDHVCGSFEVVVIAVFSNKEKSSYDAYWDRFDPVWGRILLLPIGDHTLESEVDLVGFIEPGVFRPQTEERLCNAPYVILR